MERSPLIVLTGPTAVGKTELSLELADRIRAEIINGDSMQIYKKMNIGTAKIRPEEMRGIPHHLLDQLMPDEEYNVVIFQKLAKEAMQGILSRGKIPLVVGGSGFYIQALWSDIEFTETESDSQFRKQLYQQAKEQGPEVLYQRLCQLDPESAQKIHPHNVKRVIRALEFYEKTGEKISVHNEEQKQKESPYNGVCFVLTLPREELYKRIEQRVDRMMEEGLLQEVQGLLDEGYSPDLVSMQGLGYKEFIPYLKGECTLEEAVRILKRDTRHFAKRQLTWFSGRKETLWIDKSKFENEEEILTYILNVLKERGIYCE